MSHDETSQATEGAVGGPAEPTRRVRRLSRVGLIGLVVAVVATAVSGVRAQALMQPEALPEEERREQLRTVVSDVTEGAIRGIREALAGEDVPEADAAAPVPDPPATPRTWRDHLTGDTGMILVSAIASAAMILGVVALAAGDRGWTVGTIVTLSLAAIGVQLLVAYALLVLGLIFLLAVIAMVFAFLGGL